MAVYTKFQKENIEEILSNYSIGKLNSFKGIKEGIENRTTKKAVKKPNINMYVPVKIYCY